MKIIATFFCIVLTIACSIPDPDKSNTKTDDKIKEETVLLLKSSKNSLAVNYTIGASPVTSEDLNGSPGKGDWLLYHGDYRARRFSPLAQIDTKNAGKVVSKWNFRVGEGENLRSSPLVYGGVMYVTGSEKIYAIDARTGMWLWVWHAYGEQSEHVNRGVAIFGDKIFFSTSDCRLVALDRVSGNVLWSSRYARTDLGYFSTMAPLIVNNFVVMGISNGNKGLSGFVAAFSADTGKRIWKFTALPNGTDLRGAPTWTTGSYDPDSGVLYWTVGVINEAQRNRRTAEELKNIHENSVVALDSSNGKLLWATKFADTMPFDWDANQPVVLLDAKINGADKKLLLMAHRNGLFYVLDRADGRILVSKPFIKKLKWRRGADTCPSVWGATNWMSPSFNPLTKKFYVMALEGCVNEPNRFHIKALDPFSGFIIWDYTARDYDVSAAGILTTAGGLAVSGEASGHVVILNAESGKKLWDFNTGRPIFSSPVTYLAGGKQYVSLMAGSEVFTFGLK